MHYCNLLVIVFEDWHWEAFLLKCPFAFLYYLLGIQIENLITYKGIGFNLGIFLYIEGTLAFGMLFIYEFIKFFGMIKINLQWIYFIVFTIEILKLIIMIIKWNH